MATGARAMDGDLCEPCTVSTGSQHHQVAHSTQHTAKRAPTGTGGDCAACAIFSHRSVVMPSIGVTGHRNRVGGSHPAAVPWVPGLPEIVHSLTEDPEDWGYRPSRLRPQQQHDPLRAPGGVLCHTCSVLPGAAVSCVLHAVCCLDPPCAECWLLRAASVASCYPLPVHPIDQVCPRPKRP